VTEIGPGIHRLGNRVVSFYVLEDGGRLTVIDAGAPRHIGQLFRLLQATGRTLGDVEAVVLTHAHEDHLGIAETLRRRALATVHVHEEDHPHALGEPLPERDRGLLPYLWRPAAWRTLVGLGAAGIASVRPVVEAASFGDGEALDLPGRPRAIHAPGHTPGSCVLAVGDRGAVFSGDVIVTRNPLTGRAGPQVMPAAFNDDTATALASLDRLVELSATTLLPGHGEPWSGPMAEAVAAARRAGPS
jgi:glyoxylase-like metal-dependent hydrolase (beta-lactamase superfamily II)